MNASRARGAGGQGGQLPPLPPTFWPIILINLSMQYTCHSRYVHTSIAFCFFVIVQCLTLYPPYSSLIVCQFDERNSEIYLIVLDILPTDWIGL